MPPVAKRFCTVNLPKVKRVKLAQNKQTRAITLKNQNTNIIRRSVIKGLVGALGVSTTGCSIASAISPNPARSEVAKRELDWRKALDIKNNTETPRIPARDFLLSDHVEISQTSDISQQLSTLIKTCHEAGGGRVVISAGEYSCGPIHLLSKVNLHLEKGAVLKFIPDPKRYLPEVKTRWEGMEFMGYSPLIYAYGQSDIAITGEGTLDGQANDQTWGGRGRALIKKDIGI